MRNQREPRTVSLLRPIVDAALAVGALALAFWLRIHLPLPFTEQLLPADRWSFLSTNWAEAAIAQVLVLYFFGGYDVGRPTPALDLLRRLAAAVVAQGALLTGYLFFTNRAFPRSVLALYVVLDLALLALWRLALARTSPQRMRRVAVVGAGPAAQEIAEAIRTHRWHGLEVAGYLPIPGEHPSDTAPSAALGICLGTPEDLPALLTSGAIDDVVLAASNDSWQTRLVDALAGTRPDHTSVLLLPGPFESLIGRMRYRWVHDLPLIEVVRESEWRSDRPLKRGFDLLAGGVLALLLTPVALAAAVVVKLSSPGPALYSQVRVGRDRRLFTLWKLRTMQVDAEAATGEVLAQEGDPRLTPVGAVLRKLRIDEIPQLLNVLGGSMSLVGPRPERPGFVEKYLAEVPGYAERFSVPPGLTGLAQVNGDYHSTPQNKLRYDLAYIANWSPWLDFSILLRTVKIVLTSRGV